MHVVKTRTDRLTRATCLVILLGALVAGLAFGKSLFLPIAVAIILAMILHLPLNALERLKIPRWVGIIFLTGSVGASAWFLISLLAEPIEYFTSNHEKILQDLQSKLFSIQLTLDEAQKVGSAIADVGKNVTQTMAGSQTQQVVVEESNFLVEAASSVLTSLTTIIATLVICGFILATPKPFTTLATMLYAKPTSKLFAARIWQDVEQHISYFFFVTTIINAALGTCMGVILYFLDVPMPVFWGVVVALLNYMPFIGPTIGTILLSAFCLLNFDNPSSIFLPPAIYLTINFLEANFVTPSFVGRKTEIPPLAIVLSLFFWGWLWGFIGLFLAIPVLVIVKAVSAHIPSIAVVHQILTPRKANHSK